MQVEPDGHTYHVGIPVPSGQGVRGGIKYKYPVKRWVGGHGKRKGNFKS